MFDADVWGILGDKVFHALCFVKSCIVKDEDVFLFLVKSFEQFFEEVHECQAVLCDVKIVVKLVRAGKCAECDQFFIAPKERSSWCFSTRKPDFLVGRCEVKSCFVNCYNFITQIFVFKFFLNSSRNAITFSGSFLMCCDRGVILEKSSL